MKRARFVTAARQEFLAEVAYYNDAEPGLGERFTAGFPWGPSGPGPQLGVRGAEWNRHRMPAWYGRRDAYCHASSMATPSQWPTTDPDSRHHLQSSRSRRPGGVRRHPERYGRGRQPNQLDAT